MFFLEAVSAAAADAYYTALRLSRLHDDTCALLPLSVRSKDTVRRLFGYIEQYPIIDIKHTAAALDVSYNTVSTAVNKLVSLGILHETTNAARNRVFAYEAYLGILRANT